MMQQLELLLQKFWSKQITLPELQQLHYLLSIHKDELSNQININFEAIEKELSHLLTTQKSQEILTAIHSRIPIQKPSGKYLQLKKSFYPLLAAASVIGILFVSVLWYYNVHSNKYNSIVASTTQNTIITITNNLFVNKQDTLQDGSVVTLQPGSAISYYKPFINNRRDISLIGNALFKVAKDKTMPFTVYSSGLATTALGTQFWVYAGEKGKYNVNLLEGKVVIKSANKSFAMQDVYLIAGQQFNINLSNKNYTVYNNSTINKSATTANTNIAGKKVLSFTDEPLENVMGQIENKYQKHIVFNRQDVKGLTFSGSFLATDNIQIVLSVVCNMNDLEFKNAKSSITITKKQ